MNLYYKDGRGNYVQLSSEPDVTTMSQADIQAEFLLLGRAHSATGTRRNVLAQEIKKRELQARTLTRLDGLSQAAKDALRDELNKEAGIT